MKIKALLIVFVICFFAIGTAQAKKLYLKCEEYGFYTITNNDGTCSCYPGYSIKLTDTGKLVCSKETNCTDIYGPNAINNIDGTCTCKKGYIFYNDKIGNNACIKGESQCKFIYGPNGTYNSISNTCDCEKGYELVKLYYGNGYICKSCNEIYGSNSRYNEIIKSCECLNGYEIQNGKCYKKQNTKLFYLAKYNYDFTAVVVSYNKQNAYLLKLEEVPSLHRSKEFVNQAITINLGDNNILDKNDIFQLSNNKDYLQISTKIINVKEIEYNFSQINCSRIYGKHVLTNYNNQCNCEEGYTWNEDKTNCNWISIKTKNDSFEKNTNSIFDTKNLFSNCPDLINGYIGKDGGCYCKNGYHWSSIMNKCILD